MWNERIENVVKKIGDSAKGYKIMHITAARDAYFWYNLIMYIGIFLSPLAGVLSSANIILNISGFQVLSIASSVVAGIAMAVLKFGNFEEKSNVHKTTAAKYTSLEGNIRRQLSLLPKDRIIAKEYLEWISTSFDDLFNSSPLLSPNIYEKYVRYAKEHDLSIPDEYTITIDLDMVYKSNVDTLSDIKVNKEEGKEVKLGVSSNDSKIPSRDLGDIQIVIEEKEENSKGSSEGNREKVVKRGEAHTHFGDLNRYSDPKMQYEMRRFMRID